MKVIAFSGNSNTGKSTAIQFLYDYMQKHSPDKKVLLMNESARTYIDQQGGVVDDVDAFQLYVYQQETKRLKRLQELRKSGEYDLVLIDRTAWDGMIYSYWNMMNGTMGAIRFSDHPYNGLAISKKLYDHVVFFTTPIKKDSRFDHYNNEYINQLFTLSITYFYGEKVLTYTNNVFFQNNFENAILSNILDM